MAKAGAATPSVAAPTAQQSLDEVFNGFATKLEAQSQKREDVQKEVRYVICECDCVGAPTDTGSFIARCSFVVLYCAED